MEPISIGGLLLWIAFYGCYMFKQMLLRRQGLRTDIMGHGKKPADLLSRERRLKLITYAMAATQLASLLLGGRVPLVLQALAARWAGLGLMLLGTGFFWRPWRQWADPGAPVSTPQAIPRYYFGV